MKMSFSAKEKPEYVENQLAQHIGVVEKNPKLDKARFVGQKEKDGK